MAYERYRDDLHYQASMVESTYTIGMLKGEEKGKKEGREEGRKERNREIALKLLSTGAMDLQSIADLTELSLDLLSPQLMFSCEFFKKYQADH